MIEDYKKHLKKQGFELGERVGSGLSGSTYKGFQPTLKRDVAIKFFDSVISQNNIDLKKRFLRESKLLAELQHPSIPYVLTRGDVKVNDKEIPYMVMQYIPGYNLEQYIKKHPLASLDTALHISSQILDALHFVHEKGIVHRDVKPSNIMILPSGHCYLIDFSIGFKIDPTDGLTRATRTGDHIGSIKYMPPEQADDMKSVDRRADIYSFSKVLCEILSGTPEISGLDAIDQKYPAALRKVIAQACSFSIDDRHDNANDFLRELKQVSSSELPFMDTPSKAVCINTKCPKANWSSQGYYRGAYFIDECTNPFCTSCGGKLLYQCESCGSNIDDTRYCGGCGMEQFDIPECGKCGSFLKKIDMGKDLSVNGCDRCQKDEANKKLKATVDNFDDDIPF